MRSTVLLILALHLSLSATAVLWAQQPAVSANPAEQNPVSAPGQRPEKDNSAAAPAPKKTQSKPKRHKPVAPSSDGTPKKVVVREGGANEPASQIAPDMTPAEALRQRQNAEGLLVSTGNRIRTVNPHSLDDPDQETLAQIQNYMDGARSALKEGDVRRANTLAQKAHLLAQDLVKQ